ncbi:MAG: hypothetical protein GFH27_549279n73 [Chloroflexi bacterium AL-W]|nr:hypothetical protein [Chloroflexi bacterium AL-N1]NOK65039.1 hypothetical protein [Chloroflexi bacterium AL-N10]NOK72694.1 hypothetical protein [Chloroflexi bacterium AL-N5]NOK79218.1 hypothetical protein [Chloroflexi bacterium AL-W]NOK87134.1 hypothetical protein [Chloroflexi bacterium AL-N15]
MLVCSKITRLVVCSIVLGSLLFMNTLFAYDTNAQESSPELSSENTVIHLSDSEALAEDIDILANQTGYSQEQVEQSILFQQVFGIYVDKLLIRYSDQISRVWVDPVPNTRGYIQFVDKVPMEAVTEMESINLFNADNIILSGDGLISMEDHRQRAELVADTMVDLGYQDGLTFFDPVNQKIQIELKLPEGSPQPDISNLANAVQTHLQNEQSQSTASPLQGDAAIIEMSDLDLTVLPGSGPIIELQNARGGNWLLDDGVRECTSGWSVSGPNGDGIITAAHCTGLNQFEVPGGSPFSINYEDQERGAGGDVEYHTTSQSELAEFYSNESSIRDVTGIQTTNTMAGNSVCFYGRASNTRTCNHTVEAVGVTVLASGSVEVKNLARATNASSTNGDSGGGWSISTTAWGVHHGRDSSGRAYFTPSQEAQNALGVTIKTQ